jgi:predicted DNA-binding transcriptional regulator AlpA
MLTANGVNASDALLTETQAAQVLSLSIRTLQSWRGKGSGPDFIRAGRAVRYRRSDIQDWVTSNTVSPAASSGARS